MIWEGAIKGILSLFTGKVTPLKNSRTLRIWHWIALDGPRNFWKSPKALQMGQSISTLIQMIFYPKK
jgi:hypothetical protein